VNRKGVDMVVVVIGLRCYFFFIFFERGGIVLKYFILYFNTLQTKDYIKMPF